MKKRTHILLAVLLLLISCKNNNHERKLIDNLIGIRWENSDLDFIEFDATMILIPVKDMYPTTCAFKYSIKSDTLFVINQTVNAYNIVSLKDSFSYVKIKSITKDSLKLELLNNGAKELFSDFNHFNFYNSTTIDRYSYYKEKDTCCLEQINKAKEEIKKGIYALCIHPKWPFRQEKEFVELLRKHGITYEDLGPPPDELPIERNCYRETMDYYIQKRFGKSFIDSLAKEADTLMVLTNRSKFIDFYACDERPHLPNSKPSYSESATVEVDLPIKKFRRDWKTADGRDMFDVSSPFMDIRFNIDTTGVISNFHLYSFNPAMDWNNQFKEDLFRLAVQRIKKDSIWVPGKILGFTVRTNNSVRVFFKKAEEKKTTRFQYGNRIDSQKE